MLFLQIKSITGYKPSPDFTLRIEEDGKVRYTGRYYVGVSGERDSSVNDDQMREIRLLSDFLEKRNKKNYLKKNLNPSFKIEFGDNVNTKLLVDKNDVVSEDVIQQIIELTGAHNWISAPLDLYLVMSKPALRSKELAVLRAVSHERAIVHHLEDRRSRAYKSKDDYMGIKIGFQIAGSLVNPVTYFSYVEYKIRENAPELFLNQGPKMNTIKATLKVYFYISFGKRYNDPGASYFMVIAENKDQADEIFRSTYPHFMSRDFQQVDPCVIYKPNPIFNTHIPIAIR